MHREVDLFVKEVKKEHPQYFSLSKVLEVGSLNINGSVRPFFDQCWYVGIDVGKGKGVDVVCPIHQFKVINTFDTVISTEMLEHDMYWRSSLLQMYDNLKSGGILILTCAGPTRPPHGFKDHTPQDSPFTTEYYENRSIEDLESVLPREKFLISEASYKRGMADLLFWGIKK